VSVSRPLFAVFLLIAGCGTGSSAAAAEFQFPALNHSYENLVGEAPPFTSGSLVVRLASPSQKVTLRSHRLTLEPLGDGTFRAVLVADLLGKGHLSADVSVGSFSQHLEDELLLPPQQLAILGRVRLARVPGGFRFPALELPKSLGVTIQSHVGAQVLDLCERATLLALGAFDCAALSRGLTRVEVPLPSAGGDFFLADSETSPADRAGLSALIAPPVRR